jgi:hypothetical protein
MFKDCIVFSFPPSNSAKRAKGLSLKICTCTCQESDSLKPNDVNTLSILDYEEIKTKVIQVCMILVRMWQCIGCRDTICKTIRWYFLRPMSMNRGKWYFSSGIVIFKTLWAITNVFKGLERFFLNSTNFSGNPVHFSSIDKLYSLAGYHETHSES